MTVIIGAGLSGLSAAYHLRDESLVLEKDSQVGGLCKSVRIGGYMFDYAPHIIYTRDEYVKNLVLSLLRDNLIKHTRRAYIYTNGTFVEYPFEVNLHALPQEVRDDCVNGILNRKKGNPRNFEDWIYATYGKGIAKHYMIPYNQKIWKYDLSKINIDWISGRVPKPSVQEIRQGAETRIGKNYGPNAEFYYPKHGGIGAFAENLASSINNVSLNSKVVEIKSPQGKLKIKYVKGEELREIETDKIISSVPLPEIVKMLDDVPREVQSASDSLIYNSLVCVNIGIRRPKIIDKHWIYFPEKEYIFNRMSFPMNFSEFTTPNGRSSILVEVTHREDHIDLNDVKDEVYEGLIKSEIIKESDFIEICDVSEFKYAYVIYDLEHKKNVNKIHMYLKGKNIIPIGRFGEWEYFNIDKAVLSGRKASFWLTEGKP